MANDLPKTQKSRSELLALMAEFERFGATDNGGVCRLAASVEDGQVRDYLCHWLKSHDYEVKVDAIGNIFGLLDLTQGDSTQHFFCGSHLDTQPAGGRFDGALGVACACVAGPALREAVRTGEIKTQHRFYVLNQDPAKVDFYKPICLELGLDFERFSSLFVSDEMKQATQADFQLNRQWGVRGYPTILVRKGDQLHAIATGFATFEEMWGRAEQVIKGT